MHRLSILVGRGALVLALTVTAFAPLSNPETTRQDPKKEAHYTINGVFCGDCVDGLTAVAEAIDGVEAVKIDVDERLVVVTFDKKKTSEKAIRTHINAETTFNLSLKEVKDPAPASDTPPD